MSHVRYKSVSKREANVKEFLVIRTNEDNKKEKNKKKNNKKTKKKQKKPAKIMNELSFKYSAR
jgi:RecG-like helicase